MSPRQKIIASSLIILTTLYLITGTFSPCQISQNIITDMLVRKGVSWEWLDTDLVAHHYLRGLIGGQPTPLRCLQLVYKLETRSSVTAEPAPTVLLAQKQTPAQPKPEVDERLISGGELCTRPIIQQEEALKIPPHLMEGVATTLSGRSVSIDVSVPWPWTVKIKGETHYYASKSEAVDIVEALLKDGDPNVFVGCMQLNMKDRPKTRQDIEETLDPSTNASWAARILKDQFDRDRNWDATVRTYGISHSDLSGKEFDRLLNSSLEAIDKSLAHQKYSEE